MFLSEAMLDIGRGEVVGEAGEDESLEDLGCRAEEGDGTV